MIGALLRLRSSDSVLPAKDVSQGVLFDQGEGTFGSNLEFDMIWLCEGTFGSNLEFDMIWLCESTSALDRVVDCDCVRDFELSSQNNSSSVL